METFERMRICGLQFLVCGGPSSSLIRIMMMMMMMMMMMIRVIMLMMIMFMIIMITMMMMIKMMMMTMLMVMMMMMMKNLRSEKRAADKASPRIPSPHSFSALIVTKINF